MRSEPSNTLIKANTYEMKMTDVRKGERRERENEKGEPG